jgi:hypothetical protein
MPGAEHGFKTAIVAIFIGVIVSAILSAISGELGSLDYLRSRYCLYLRWSKPSTE